MFIKHASQALFASALTVVLGSACTYNINVDGDGISSDDVYECLELCDVEDEDDEECFDQCIEERADNGGEPEPTDGGEPEAGEPEAGEPEAGEPEAGEPEPQPTDTDGDGLSDAFEAERGTNPQNPDTDGDGQDDGHEVDCGSSPLDPQIQCETECP